MGKETKQVVTRRKIATDSIYRYMCSARAANVEINILEHLFSSLIESRITGVEI
jgi:hypothetical protein